MNAELESATRGTEPREARIAYFVLAHQRPAQLALLVDAIADERDLVFIHVDLKSMLGLKAERRGMLRMAWHLAATRPNVRLLPPRFTNWGGWSLSGVLLAAIRSALADSPDWTHFINLSGQCYPIKPLAHIRQVLRAAGERVFVEFRHFSTLPRDDWHLRFRPMLELPVRAVALPWRRASPSDFELEYKGSQWCILSRSFCEWQAAAPNAARIKSYLKHLHLSDELIIQTLVRNGPFRDRVMPHYGREIVWPGPKLMTVADLPALRQSPALFSRKFDVARDPQVLVELAREHGLRHAGASAC